MAVHAHPDDETITTGGTLARYSAEGVRTIVVTCTRGDLGELNGLPPQDVGALRQRELRCAIEKLGVSRLVELGYGDSGMPGAPQPPGSFGVAPLQEAAEKLAAIIEQERPQVLLAYDETGGYGHPDHLKAHEVAVAAVAITMRAAHTATDAEFNVRAPRLYFVRFPLTWSRTFVQSLRAAGIDAPLSAPAGADAGPDAVELGVPDELVTTRIDVAKYVATKRAALACHRSQMPPEHFLMRMPAALAERLWAYESFSRADLPPGQSCESDLFAGLD